MNEASTLAKTDEIRRKLQSANCKLYALLEWYDDDTDTWYVLNDLDVEQGMDWEQGGVPQAYSRIITTPQASEIRFSIVNLDGKYSEGSNVSDGILINDRRVRIRAGYWLPGQGTTVNYPLPLAENYYYKMKTSGGSIIYDDANTEGGSTAFNTMEFATKYDSINYDAGFYSAAGFWIGNLDLLTPNVRIPQTINVTIANCVAKVYYRGVNDPEYSQPTEGWVLAGSAVAGSNSFTISGIRARCLQVMVVVDGSLLTGATISALSIDVLDEIEYIYTHAYHLDTPLFPEPQAPQTPRVECVGRDIYKRAIDSEINIANLSAGVSIDELIKQICDAVEIPYSATSIDDLSAYGDRTFSDGYDGMKKPNEIFSHCMAFLMQSGMTNKYQMYCKWDDAYDDCILYVKPRNLDIESVFTMNYKYYEKLGTRSKTYDKIINRITFLTPGASIGPEELIASVQHDADGEYTLTYPTDGFWFIRPKITGTGSRTIVLLEQQSDSVRYTHNGTGTVYLAFYGCPVTGITNIGEFSNMQALLNKKGQSFTAENPLIISEAEARAMAEGFIEDSGNPANEANNLDFPYANLIPEINDLVLLVSRYNFDSNLYRVRSCKHHWDIFSDTSTFNLDDAGISITGYCEKYDDPANEYDKGYIYDWAQGPFATYATILANTKRYKDI